MALIELTSDLSRKDTPQKIDKIIGRPSPRAIIRDTARVTKFLLSPKGLIFTAKQFAQQLMNPNTENIAGRAGIGLTKIYDPISPITNTIGAPLGLRTDRFMPPVARAPGSTYEGIHKARKSSPLHSQIDNNRLIRLTNELIIGNSVLPQNATLEQIQIKSNLINNFPGKAIQTLSGLTGPKSVGGIGATTIRRYEDTTKANLQDQFEIKLQSDPGLLGNTAPEISGFEKTKKEVSLLGKYKAVSYGQIPRRNHSTTIIDFREIRDGKTGNNTHYDAVTSRKSNFNSTLQLIDTIDKTRLTEDISNPENYSLIDFQFSNSFREIDIKFKAYLGMLSDNFAPSWNSAADQGRADLRYQYSGFERNISFDFMVVIENKNDGLEIWKKLRKLALLTHPTYGSQGFFGNTVNVTIGKLFDERPMIIQDLGYDWDNETPWEIDENRQHPMYTSVAMSCIVLGDRPQTTSPVYDIPDLVEGTVDNDREGSITNG